VAHAAKKTGQGRSTIARDVTRAKLSIRVDPGQGDLSNTQLIQLPPCGRGYGRCEAVIETDSAGMFFHCVKCDCIAPHRPAAVDREIRDA